MMEKKLDSKLWHACAGGMVQMPSLNSKLFYFPQGHAEHTSAIVDFSGLPRIPPMILCRAAAVNYLADPETDEVYARIRLIPIGINEACFEMEGKIGFGGDNLGSASGSGSESSVEKSASFAKTLTQSDANNGGGFSVPRYCAETIFPKLDFSTDPPYQTIEVKDVHGETFSFRHIYRGTPRRHLLTTGWSGFVNLKKLVAGDSIVFFRAENGTLHIGIRRAKRGGVGGGPESSSGWNPGHSTFGSFSVFLKDDGSNNIKKNTSNGSLNSKRRGKLTSESVLEAVNRAANGHPFEVLYYPLAGTSEFFVKASSVNSALRIQWCGGMRFKMPFETEDVSRISWFMGTISSVQFADPILWPNSPWRLLQVSWDEPDLMQNVKSVNPWLVELVSSMPVIHLPPYSPPTKKMRIPQHLDFLYDAHFPMPPFSGSPFGPSSPFRCLSNNNNVTTVGIQGARHAQFGVPLPDLQLSNKLHLGLLDPSSFHRLDPLISKIPDGNNSTVIRGRREDSNDDDVSCVLTMGSPHEKSKKTTPQFLLFGQPILTEQQLSEEGSGDLVSKVGGKGSSCVVSLETEERFGFEQRVHHETGFSWNQEDLDNNNNNNTSHCKVFLDSEDVGRTLDLSVLGSYNELFQRLGNMFGLERSEIESHVFYCDLSSVLKQIGDEAFSVFVKTAKRLTISTATFNSIKRKWMTGLSNAGRGLESSNRTGPLSIFA